MKRMFAFMTISCAILFTMNKVHAIARASTVDLIRSILIHDQQSVRDDIEGGAILDERIGSKKLTPLMIAIHELCKEFNKRWGIDYRIQRLEIVKELIRASSLETIMLTDAEGRTALQILWSYALELGDRSSDQVEMLKQIELLLVHKIDVNEQRI